MESESMEKALITDYERHREERIKANLEAMRKLGIVNLSRDVKTAFSTPYSTASHERKKKLGDLSPPLPPRRSRRLQILEPVVRIDTPSRKSHDMAGGVIVLDKEDMGEEFYTEEHEKLLGSCELPWTLFVDGYSKDGTLIYDQVNGKTCHQCRYGENILEAIKNPDWICPVYRDICNCAFCRLKKPWDPTGPLYKMVVKLGYKSVAHYLIQTCRKPENLGETPSSKNAATMSDNTEASKENQPKPVMPEQTDDNIIVVSSDESSATDDGESTAKCCWINREKEEGHCGNFGPGPIASRLRSRRKKAYVEW